MPTYRIHRMKDGPRENFRWAAHTGGLARVKLKDFDFSGEIQAASPYAAWKTLASESNALRPGDLLETVPTAGSSADLKIAKYIGFEPAEWYIPELRTDASSVVVSSSVPAES